MQTIIANRVFVFIDEVLKKHVHAFARIHNRTIARQEPDDMQISDEMLKIVIVSIDGNEDKETYQEIFDHLKFRDYEELLKHMNELVNFEKKSEISNTSTKPFSDAEADVSPKNG